jgi:hypothetical protein
LGYDSKDASRDRYWRQEAVKEAGFSMYQPLKVSPVTLQDVVPALMEMTSRRRLLSK